MERNKKIVRTSMLGIVANVALVIFKSIIGLFSNSIAIILDAVNNLTDVLSSLITIIGTKLANKAPDKEHPYGHGRIEYLTSVAIATIILLAGITAIKESFIKIIQPAKVEYSIVSLSIIAVAVLVKLFLGKYVKREGNKVNSQSLVASGQDALMDAILSFSTLVAGIVNYTLGLSLEGYLGIIISVFIIKSAVEMLRVATDLMLGQRADSELCKKIKENVMTFPEVQGVYDLNLHSYGPASTVASLHIQVRNDMNAGEIHILTREIAYQIYNDFGIALTIGIYAANDKGEFGKMKEKLELIVKDYEEVLQIHGFYVDKKKLNVFFDLVVDFEAKDKRKIENEIVGRLKESFPEYNYNVILDPDITD
ncbi:MAG: cation transporter [Bacilli bacterium]|nr:cation transporter [Bacilli bacterium]